ncbi:type IV pilus biogenesis/stability protein PilW [Thalassotalea sp. PLHSN55]|uniref:type IV pilus biogenesis/stability protein PilW n=1 Tax=Thalassotalea sp. PLHSN55 TaxID=3435888 RepID=UPI003F83C84E
MVKQLKKFIPLVSVILPTMMLSACVTENFENDKSTPVIQNDSTSNEIAMTRISLGLGYLKMGNTTQAKLNLEKAKRFSPDLAQVHTAFAHYYETVGEPELATTSYEHALSLSENDADTLNNYGVFLCRQGKYDEAEKQILKAIAVPSYLLVSQSYENLAMCQLKDNRFDKAELYFEKAIQHNPSNANVYLQMVQLKYAKGEYKNAQLFLKRYEKATRRFSPQALALAYKVYVKQRQLGTAKNYASMLVKMFPNSYEAKQYVLNGLERIQADELADDYKQSLASRDGESTKKRVVVLSPNKQGDSQTTLVSRKSTQPTAVKKQVAKKQVDKKEPPSNTSIASAVKQASPEQVLSEQGTPKLVLPDATVQTQPAVNEAAEEIVQAKAIPTNVITQAEQEKVNKIAANKAYQALIKEQLAKAESSQVLPPNSRAQKTQPIVDEKTAVKQAAEIPKHIVAKGESLFFISQKYNIKISALKKWNKLSASKVIKIGDTIFLANPEKAQ